MSSWPSTSELDLHPALSFSEEYDDVSELIDLPSSVSTGNTDKAIRRRSSKACDQCRKSKCKCERPAPSEPCRSCVALGTPCTFLGPSRKRGPPKGYIDAIEARLHQTEALLGIMLSSNDERALSLLRDISLDPLAREIIDRVDNSPYGVKGRLRLSGGHDKGKPRHTASPSSGKDDEHKKMDITSTHPSNEWQDQVIAMLRNSTSEAARLRGRESLPAIVTSLSSYALTPLIPGDVDRNGSDGESRSPDASNRRRQRRRLDRDDHSLYQSPQGSSVPNSATLPVEFARPLRDAHYPGPRSPSAHKDYLSSTPLLTRGNTSPSLSSCSDDDFVEAVGQLSLNEDEEVRYHGKASGLHLLGIKDRSDRRSEGGIWRFPKARVWPPLPSGSASGIQEDEGGSSKLPPFAVQEHLLELYFTYVHPSLPIVHKEAFLTAFTAGNQKLDSPQTPESDTPHISQSHRRRRRVPTLLLFAMFSIAARYSDHPSTPKPPSDPFLMWIAGDQYLDEAKTLLDRSYASSRPSTCQALLLMGYREIGIGAMAQAWTYIGMAIRMAQDLGMHRKADGWARVGVGGRLFNDWELNERRRIWYTCVIMDKYVSSYIGRPLAIFDGDFDTLYPTEDDPEESEEWRPHLISKKCDLPVRGRIISCFNASAVLSGILGTIIQAMYAVTPISSRHAQATFLEGLLDKWYLELPEHLRHEPGARHPVPLPHVLTLHMQYWCVVLLLHRPFIRLGKHSDGEDNEVRSITDKNYELCIGAANHITAIASLYSEKYPINRCTVFLCYYIFTASVMHVTGLSLYPNDPQARLGLTKCMEVLSDIEIVWPSAGRALELLRGSKVNVNNVALTPQSTHSVRHKRSVEQSIEDRLTSNSQFQGQGYTTDITRSESYRQSDGQASYPEQVLLPPVASSALPYPSYTRWQADNSNHNVPFPGTISTSVLPQVYSTGLFDERGQRTSAGPDTTHSRFPQYWNDYSTYSQLGSYGFNDQQPQPQTHSISSQMFLSEPYNRHI